MTSAPQMLHHEEQDPLLGQEDHGLRKVFRAYKVLTSSPKSTSLSKFHNKSLVYMIIALANVKNSFRIRTI